jgi:hypothetical protein
VKEKITRRRFLKSTGGALAITSLGAGSILSCQSDDETELTTSGKGKMIQKRVLGETGEELSIIGFGGIVV